MKADDLLYTPLSTRLGAYSVADGLPESAAFLVWFLENIYRLDATDARDAVCDYTNDRGVDGIYVDDNERRIHILQVKIRQKPNGTVGDSDPKRLVGSLAHFKSAEAIEEMIAGKTAKALVDLIARTRVKELVGLGYDVVGIYVTNELQDADSRAYEAAVNELTIYDRAEIASRFVDIEPNVGKGAFTFDTSYVEPIEMSVGSGVNTTVMFTFPARALQLVHLEGIADGSLFKENVRYTLGNTPVNKSIRQSIADKNTHGNFVLFHNGITILCASAKLSKDKKELEVHGYSVVNGAQSLTSFHSEKAKLTDDLRVMLRVVVVRDPTLAAAITENSNNQNAIKSRDLRSNDLLMQRLQAEMLTLDETNFFEVKRGEPIPDGRVALSNDTAGRALLAFDLHQPWSAHQVYRIFELNYTEIFGRPEVNAKRVLFVCALLDEVRACLPRVNNRPMASYTLTPYFILYVLSRILRSSEASLPVVVDPGTLGLADRDKFFATCREILKTIVVDLNFFTKDVDFDYKSEFKSRDRTLELADKILASYEKDVAREKALDIGDWRSFEL